MAKAWIVRSEFENGSLMDKFLSEGVIAIDYDQLPSLQGRAEDEIKQVLKENYPNLNDRQISMRANTLERMANIAAIGDYVVVTDKEKVTFGKLTSDYIYDPNRKEEGLMHRRRVEWLKGPLLRGFTPELIRSSLQAPISFSNISQYVELVVKFINLPMPAEGEEPPLPKSKRAAAKKETAKPPKAAAKELKKESPVAPVVQASPAASYEEAPAQAPRRPGRPPASAKAAAQVKTFNYPIRFNQDVTLTLPGDITQQEAERLSKFVRTLYFK